MVTFQEALKMPVIRLGIVHILVGALILFIRYVLNIDLVEVIAIFTATLPVWTLFLAAFVEGVYGLAGVTPGGTFIFLYIFGQTCSVSHILTSIILIWLGIAVGIVVSYAIGSLLRRRKKEDSNQTTTASNSLFDFVKRMPLGVTPAFSSVYLFESGYRQQPFFPVFVPVILGSIITLSIAVPFLCVSKDAFSDAVGELSLVFGLGLILWGTWKIVSTLLRS